MFRSREFFFFLFVCSSCMCISIEVADFARWAHEGCLDGHLVLTL